jgi:hypothetical protein
MNTRSRNNGSNHRQQRRFWRDNGLSITLFVLFIVTLTGQAIAGWVDENQERVQHGESTVRWTDYLRSGQFLEVTMENWESEFLQMFVYVVFTVFLFQRGSAESKDPDRVEPSHRVTSRSPAPVRAGGWRLRLYENSLSLTFLVIFVATFLLHAIGGADQYNQELMLHGEQPISVAAYLRSSRFWFESLQNWQSEFLSLWAMVVGSIFLRQRGSAESKPVEAAHSHTE